MEKEKIELKGKVLVAEELTVRQVDQVMASLVKEEIHPLEAMCSDEPIPAVAVALSVGVEVDDLSDLKPSQVVVLFKQVREANSFLAQAVEGLGTIAQKLLANEQNQTLEEGLKISEDQSAG